MSGALVLIAFFSEKRIEPLKSNIVPGRSEASVHSSEY